MTSDGRNEAVLRSFIEIADDVLDNPWPQRKAEIRQEYVVDEATPGRGTWRLFGPSELELKALLIDLRNIIQPGSAQYLPKVLEAFASEVDDAEAWDAADRALVHFVETSERGALVVDGKRVEPWRVANLWLYGRYHHREIAKAEQLRALEPILRFALRAEFLNYLANLFTSLVEVCDLVTVAKERGYLSGVPLSRGALPVAQPTDEVGR